MRLKHLLKDYSSLGRFKGLATLQAACFVARRDPSTKRAHPLRREIAVVCFHSKHLPQRSSDECARTANTDNKRVKDGIHNSTSRFFLALQVHNDTATLVILCKSARLGDRSNALQSPRTPVEVNQNVGTQLWGQNGATDGRVTTRVTTVSLGRSAPDARHLPLWPGLK